MLHAQKRIKNIEYSEICSINAYSTSKFPLNGCNNQEVLENRSRICGLHPRIYMQDLAKKMILNRFPAPSKQEP